MLSLVSQIVNKKKRNHGQTAQIGNVKSLPTKLRKRSQIENNLRKKKNTRERKLKRSN